MARSRELRVVIAGDADKLEREIKRSNRGLDTLGKQTRLTGSITSRGFAGMRVAAVGATAAFGGLALAGKSVAGAFIEAEKSEARLRAQMKASGLSFRAHSAEIERVIQKTSQLAGLDDEDLTDAFTNIVRVTGNVNKSLRLTGLAADFARAKQIDVAKAGEIVGKVAGGNIGVLGRYGIKVKEGATATEALGLLQQKFAGQAEAYGRTTGGAVDRAGVAFENLQETVGEAAAPAIEKLANRTAKFVNEMQTGTGQGGRFVDTLKDVWSEAKPIVTWIGRATKNVAQFVDEHPNVAKLAAAIVGVGVAVKSLKFVSAVTGFSDLVKAGRGAGRLLNRVLGRAGTAAGEETAANAAAGVTAKSGLVRSAGRKIADSVKRILGRGGTAAGESMAVSAAGSLGGAAAGSKFRTAGSRVGRAASKGLVIGIAAGFIALVPDLVEKISNSIINAPGRFFEKAGRGLARKLGIGTGDGIGKVVARTIPNIMGGKSAGSLMGANRALAPIASVGAGFGLRVSSGKRAAGGRTSSGGISYHGSGEAIDMAGSPGAMMRTFRALKSSMGRRLAELIYTPGGVGVKDGRPHRYTGQVAADHYDHVHAALDLGRPGPGIGDGYGKSRIQNLWTTAGGSAAVSNLAAAVALAESGGNPDAKNVNSNGSIDRGLWQINSIHGKLSTFDPMGNARAAVKISSGGRNWRPWVAYTNGAYKRFLSGGGGAGGGSSAASTSASSGPSLTEQRERSGSRLVNTIAAKFTPAIRRATKRAASLGEAIEAADTAYGQSEREFGQSEENLGTAAGRTARLSELAALKDQKRKQITRQRKRARALSQAISKLEALLRDGRKARDRSKGQKRAKIIERLRAYEDRLTDLKAELKSLGVAIKDTQLDIGDLDKEAREVTATPDAEDTTSETTLGKLGAALSLIDLQERAGVLTAEQARQARIDTLTAASQGAFGGLDQRGLLQVLGDLREAQGAAADATNANTEALQALADATRENSAQIAAQLAFANQVVSTQNYSLAQSIVALVSGDIAGSVAGRALVPGAGAQARY